MVSAGGPGPGGARRGPRRALVFIGAGLFMVALAFVVARPPAPSVATTPYAGLRGAARGKAAGLEIFYRRGGEVHVLEPGVALRAGDVLRLAVRGERPRYLTVQLRDVGAAAVTVFPVAGPQAQLVKPGDTLPVAPALGVGLGHALVVAVFADHPFAVDAPPDSDTETVSVQIEKAAP